MTTWTELAKQHDLKYFLIAFVDLFGGMRAKLVPATAMDSVAKSGAGFAGFAAWFDMTPADPDVLVMPDMDTLTLLPWKPGVAWVTGDLYMGGKPVAQNPRQVLKGLIAKAAERGVELKTGVECEYFLISPDGTAISDPADQQAKPCYDQQALMRRYEIVAEICDAMIALGWKPYQNDHEDANGQFEMNWEFDTALKTADRHAFFKFMVKSIAEKHGYKATFMPKPFANLTGNGCHVHASLWSTKDGSNVFEDESGELGLSRTAYHFIGGLVHSAEAICAITNPTVNSYKRINAPRTLSGATWSPNTVTHGGNNRTHMIRIPDAGRFEFRLPDGAVNPYLLPAALLAAGLDGMANTRDPGPRLDINMYTEGAKAQKAKQLPLNLLDALRALEASEVLKGQLGEIVGSYLKLKHSDWNEHCRQLTEWERQTTLDC
ncbi:gamma-glutamylmethylamide synthetase [Bradyrhizobium sp. NFR13]|uniref:type III glutamate--ammonia ligase n=1 Tax=Bradyrhizobium sp. NFR13 TaxID=1566285 RepID=UPI0008DF47BD|nr:type III glutamate--ammonia ligase [Bradyrhizobium sp. NFR13]SFL82326.1 gamma-glutamylmethylamide synthetase [Bradyrhizobium sp. NFR13]